MEKGSIPKVVTASRKKRAPASLARAPISRAGLRTPVEVSPCTRATMRRAFPLGPGPRPPGPRVHREKTPTPEARGRAPGPSPPPVGRRPRSPAPKQGPGPGWRGRPPCPGSPSPPGPPPGPLARGQKAGRAFPGWLGSPPTPQGPGGSAWGASGPFVRARGWGWVQGLKAASCLLGSREKRA